MCRAAAAAAAAMGVWLRALRLVRRLKMLTTLSLGITFTDTPTLLRCAASDTLTVDLRDCNKALLAALFSWCCLQAYE